MDRQTYLIVFEGVSAAQANLYAEDLRNALLNAKLQAQRFRQDQSTMDPGQIVQIVLDSTALATLITVLGKWLLRKRATLKFTRPDGEVIAFNVSEKTLIQLAEILLKSFKEPKKSDE
jgi:hypothetical protein